MDGTVQGKHIKYLYRYYRPQNWLAIARILVQNKLLFSDISSFNDPFDCTTNINCENASEEVLMQYCFHLVEKKYKGEGVSRTSEQIKEEAEHWVSEGKHKKFLEKCSIEIQNSAKGLSQIFKILCLTENPKSIPMWSHYADKHRGVVFQFDKSRLLDEHGKDKCFNVDYRKDFPSLKEYVDCVEKDDSLKLCKLFYCTKHKEWENEREWRIFSKKDVHDIPDGMLTGIILGCKNEEKDLIIALNSQRERPITIYYAEQSKKSFELVITSENREEL